MCVRLLRQVTLYEELLLLKDFEKSENQIAAKVEAKQQERLDMQAKVCTVVMLMLCNLWKDKMFVSSMIRTLICYIFKVI